MKKVKSEEEVCNWFEDNFKQLGYDSIIERNKRSFPDYVMVKNGEKVKVEIETVLSHFNYHKHNLDDVDDVVCIKKDTDLPLNVICLNDVFSFRDRTSIMVDKEFKNKFKRAFLEYKSEQDKLDLSQQEFLKIVIDFWKEKKDLRG